jgi:D-alanine-D-alanine ligase
MRAHRLAGCDGYSRTDFIVPREDGREGEPVALEINTLPGLTARSLVPRAAAAAGLDFRGLCLAILELALAARRTGRGGGP